MPIGGVIGDLINVGGQIIGNRMTNKANRELAEYSYEKDLEQWNRANAYNDPSAVMQRLKAAGLNPALIYGSGAGAGGSAAPSPSYNTPKADMRVNIPNSILTYAQVQNMNAQTDNLKAQTANTNARTVNESLRASVMGTGIESSKVRMEADRARTDLTRFQLESGGQLLPYQLEGQSLSNLQRRQELQLGAERLLSLPVERRAIEVRTRADEQAQRFAAELQPGAKQLQMLHINDEEWQRSTQPLREEMIRRGLDKIEQETRLLINQGQYSDMNLKLIDRTGVRLEDPAVIKMIALTAANIGVSIEQAIKFLFE